MLTHLRFAGGLCVAVALLWSSSGTAQAADDPAAKGPAVGDETASVQAQPLQDHWYNPFGGTRYRYVVRLFVTNGSTEDSTMIVTLNGSSGGAVAMGTTEAIQAGDGEYVTLVAEAPSRLKGDVVVEVTATGMNQATSAVVDMKVLPNKVQYWWAFGFAIVSAVLIMGGLFLAGLGKASKLAVGPAWKFSDSWATNITLIGGSVTTLLGLTGFLEELAPNLSIGRILAINAVYLVLALVAPVVFLLFAHRVEVTDQVGNVVDYRLQGSKVGFILSASVTSAAFLGQASISWLIVAELRVDTVTRWALFFLIVAVIALIISYVFNSASKLFLATSPPTPVAPGFATAAIAGVV